MCARAHPKLHDLILVYTTKLLTLIEMTCELRLGVVQVVVLGKVRVSLQEMNASRQTSACEKVAHESRS